MQRRAFLFGSATFGIAASAPARAQSRLRPLNLGFTSRSATDWPLYVASKLGFYEANGLHVDEVVIGSSAGCAQQLTAGSIDLGSVSATQVVEAVMGGAPIVEVVNEVVTPPYFIIGRKGFTSVAQFKGKTIIVGGPNDITRVLTDKVLAANHLRPEDVTYIFAGATSDRFAALLSGTVDGAILFPPFAFHAAAQGYPVVAQVQKYVPNFPFGGLAARIEWAKSHRDLVVAFDKSYLQGVRWLADSRNRARAVQILIEMTNTNADDGNKTYDVYVGHPNLYSQNGRFADPDFAQVLDALQKTKDISPPVPAPSRFFDNSYADAALAQLRGTR